MRISNRLKFIAVTLGLGAWFLTPQLAYATGNTEPEVIVAPHLDPRVNDAPALGVTAGYDFDSQDFDYNLEAVFPLAENFQLRAATDFNDEARLLGTVSLPVGGSDVYLGAGGIYHFGEDGTLCFTTQAGLDLDLGNSTTGLAYINYSPDTDQVGFHAGLAYRFGGGDGDTFRARESHLLNR